MKVKDALKRLTGTKNLKDGRVIIFPFEKENPIAFSVMKKGSRIKLVPSDLFEKV